MKFDPMRKGVPYLSFDNRVDIAGYKNVSLLSAIGMLMYPTEADWFSHATVASAANRFGYCFNMNIERSKRTREDCCYEAYSTYFEQNAAAAEKFRNDQPYECKDTDIQKALTRIREEMTAPVEIPVLKEVVENLAPVEETPIEQEPVIPETKTEEVVTENVESPVATPIKEEVSTPTPEPTPEPTPTAEGKTVQDWMDAMGEDISETIRQLKLFHTSELQKRLSDELKVVIGNDFPSITKALEDDNFCTALCNKFCHVYPFVYYRIYVVGQKL